MLNKLLRIGLLFAFLGLTACVSKPTSADYEVYTLETKAKVIDKATEESYNVDLTFTVLPYKFVRLDVTAILGYKLAELLMNTNQIQYSLREQKVFVTGPFKSKTLRPLFKQDMNPALIWNAAHGVFVKDGMYDGQKVVTEVLSQSDQYTSRRLTIENQNFKFIWLFKSKEVSEASHDETFVLKRPENYKIITIK